MSTLLHPVRIGSQAAIPREEEDFDLPAPASKMWLPAFAMGVMAIAAGVVAGAIQATSSNAAQVAQIAAWNPGVLFLGIGFLLSAVTFTLARILGELRDGGTSVQRSLGEHALILKRPWSGYVFPPAMMMGLMTLIGTFVLGFVQAARLDNNPASAADIAAWSGPVRFAGVAMIFTSVVFALVTIMKSLRFQADRLTHIADTRR
ncbi:MAG TPA: hypothetical protein VFA44_15975 [Gaiellaceae bacterium]|nr:hypothetical protein [Gaiellaceae bacterium]